MSSIIVIKINSECSRNRNRNRRILNIESKIVLRKVVVVDNSTVNLNNNHYFYNLNWIK